VNKDITINVHHITRVEGHGNLVVNLKEGKLEKINLEIVESPRFFESFLRGRYYSNIPLISSRICGICACSHNNASLLAVEGALGIKPSQQVVKLRKLNLCGEIIQSHILHFYFLALPDFLRAPSIIPLATTHLEEVKRGMRLKELANDICVTLAGRHIMPVANIPGGITSVPPKASLQSLKERMIAARSDLWEAVELFSTLETPKFERETTFVSLKRDDEYAFYDGDIYFSTGKRVPPGTYLEYLKEKIFPHSTAKHCFFEGKPYMVGALARVHNNYELLHPQAKEALKKLFINIPTFNPFHINQAQLVEAIHFNEVGIELIEELLKEDLRVEELKKPNKYSSWVGATEAPRGLLLHDYTFGKDACLIKANCIIPTAQNLANLEEDLQKFLLQLLDKPQEEITLLLEMLIRAYDPCISCSVHCLKVEYV